MSDNRHASGWHDIRYLFLSLNLWLCLGSVILVVATAMALAVPVRSIGAGLLLPACACLVVYIEDRRRIAPEDRINAPRRSALVETYAGELRLLVLGGFVAYQAIVVWFAASIGANQIKYVLAGQLPFLVGVIYPRLKRFPVLDSAAVAAVWAFVPTYAVLITTGHPVDRSVAVVVAAWMLIVFAGAESRNIQHRIGDVQADKPGIVMFLGERSTAAGIVGLKLAGVLVLVAATTPGAGAVAGAYLLVLWYFRWVERRTCRGATELDRELPAARAGVTSQERATPVSD